MCLQSLQISLTQIGSRGSLTRRMRSLKSCLCEEERNTVTLFMLNRRTLFFAVIKGSRLTCQTDRPNGQEVKPLVTPEASLQRVSSSKKSHASKKKQPTASCLDSSYACILFLSLSVACVDSGGQRLQREAQEGVIVHTKIFFFLLHPFLFLS